MENSLNRDKPHYKLIILFFVLALFSIYLAYTFQILANESSYDSSAYRYSGEIFAFFLVISGFFFYLSLTYFISIGKNKAADNSGLQSNAILKEISKIFIVTTIFLLVFESSIVFITIPIVFFSWFFSHRVKYKEYEDE